MSAMGRQAAKAARARRKSAQSRQAPATSATPTGIVLTPFTAPERPSARFVKVLRETKADTETIRVASGRS